MKLEKQVCSLDLAKRLKELGVKQESYFLWLDYGSPHLDTAEAIRSITYEKTQNERTYSAFTVAELGELLPCHVRTNKSMKDCCDYGNIAKGFTCFDGNVLTGKRFYLHAETEADARAKMLIYLIENKLTNPN